MIIIATMSNSKRKASLPTIKRIPTYLNVLEGMRADGKVNVSATDIAGELNLKSIQVRKDLNVTGLTGKPKIGYDINELITSIKEFLGWLKIDNAILVGAGALGSALLGYKEFEKSGIRIIAAFDNNPGLINKEIHGVSVKPMDQMKSIVQSKRIKIGIIAAPAEFAQEIADSLVDAGIKGIWNFAPILLKVPDSVVVQREDLSSGLAVLSVRLEEKLGKNNSETF